MSSQFDDIEGVIKFLEYAKTCNADFNPAAILLRLNKEIARIESKLDVLQTRLDELNKGGRSGFFREVRKKTKKISILSKTIRRLLKLFRRNVLHSHPIAHSAQLSTHTSAIIITHPHLGFRGVIWNARPFRRLQGF